MKHKSIVFALLFVMLFSSITLAEDGAIFRRNVSKTPLAETEKAAIYMMDFYVPAQASTGDLTIINNYVLSDTVTYLEEREYAKPLVSVYIDDIGHEEIDAGLIGGGMTFGHFDAFVAVSLDDGTSWRTENLSRSNDLSSFTLANGHPYPGDVHALVHQVAEDKIFVAWASKYCQSGNPLYSLDLANTDVQTYLADLEATYGKNAMYLYDLFGVAGTQGSVDYTLQGFPEIGEIPYSCVWTARGKLLPGDDPKTTDVAEASHVVWTKPERLTSGVRDANLPAVDCAKNAGCALTWQEDPEGLRPGKGLGPGEGWSGAIANAKTDIWYSYITFADFDYVLDEETGTAMLIEEYEALKLAEMDMPKPYVPMAMPVRLTDNDMCKGTNESDPYCWIDFDTIDTWDHTNVVTNLDNLVQSDASDYCATTIQWTNPGGTTLPICVTDDGRVMIGRVGSTRVRMIIKPYTPAGAPDHDADGVPDASAWLSLAAEETKALGDTLVDPYGNPTDEPLDIGKDVWYYSFDYAKPYNLHVNTALDTEDPSPYVVRQGGMLNQPAICSPWTVYADPDAATCTPYEFFPVQTAVIGAGTPNEYEIGEFWLTEISRRFALTLNNPGNITDPAVGGAGLSGILIYKQGIIWQGGPADIMLRRVAVDPFCVDADDDGNWDTEPCFDKAVDNPYAFKNMECADDGNPDTPDGWIYTDGTNPNYLEGMCLSAAINISGSTIKACDGGTDNDTCADLFPVADDGSIPYDTTPFPKVREWRQLPYDATADGDDFTGDPSGDLTDIDDQSWENPYDVAKGHRGFLYGDYVMMMYAWSPNWQSNRVGNDHYNLYQRRSFDGGSTWTTTPPDWCDANGNCGVGIQALEFYYGDATGEYVPLIWDYAAGAAEQARNLSLLKGNKVTILDPRYSPGGGLKQYATIRTDWLTDNADLLPEVPTDDVLPYTDDAAIDPSKYMMIYETGDNTTVDVGEAIPLDLFYSRATVFGDIFEWFDYVNDDNDDPLVEPRWPWLENKTDDLSGEASVVLNPGGTFSYQVWNQWKEEILPDGEEFIYDSDMIFRRLLYLTDDAAQTTDFNPISRILYVSTTQADFDDPDIVLIGSGRDLDRMGNADPGGDGIVNQRWWSDIAGHECNERTWQFPPRGLIPGWHGFSFSVQDNEGNWSQPQTVMIWIGPKYTNYLPLISR